MSEELVIYFAKYLAPPLLSFVIGIVLKGSLQARRFLPLQDGPRLSGAWRAVGFEGKCTLTITFESNSWWWKVLKPKYWFNNKMVFGTIVFGHHGT